MSRVAASESQEVVSLWVESDSEEHWESELDFLLDSDPGSLFESFLFKWYNLFRNFY